LSAFKRMYLDVPSELHADMKTRCAELHETQAVFIRTAIAERIQKLKQENSKHGNKEKTRK
jgi:hypothetical protein